MHRKKGDRTSMNTLIQIISSPLASRIGGALVTLITVYLTGKSKIRELKLQYQQKLEESHREQAHQSVDALYKPLYGELTKLDEHYANFYNKKGIDSADIEEVQQACKTFLANVSGMLHQGLGGYLTQELGEWLNDFMAFLEMSIQADAAMFISPSCKGYLFLFWPFISIGSSQQTRRQLDIVLENYALYAPIDTRAFERRFYHDIHLLQQFIREVMLKSKVTF